MIYTLGEPGADGKRRITGIKAFDHLPERGNYLAKNILDMERGKSLEADKKKLEVASTDYHKKVKAPELGAQEGTAESECKRFGERHLRISNRENSSFTNRRQQCPNIRKNYRHSRKELWENKYSLS